MSEEPMRAIDERDALPGWASSVAMGGVLAGLSALLAVVVGSGCGESTNSSNEGAAVGQIVSSSGGRSEGPPITFQAVIEGLNAGRPGERVSRSRLGVQGVTSGADYTKFVYAWTPPPGVSDLDFSVAPTDPGGPPYVWRNVPGSTALTTSFTLPDYPPGKTTQKLVDSLQVTYEDAESLASLTTFMPNLASCRGADHAAQALRRPAAAAASATASPQVWYTSHYLQFDSTLSTTGCQQFADLLQSGRAFLALRVPAAPPSGTGQGAGDVVPVSMRSGLSPSLSLTRRPPTTTYFSLDLDYQPSRYTFLENTLPGALDERWLALGAVATPRAVCPTIVPPAPAGGWQFVTNLNFDLPADVGTLPAYLCYEGANEPFPSVASVIATVAAARAGLDAVQGSGITCMGPMPLGLGALTVVGGASPRVVPASSAATTIKLPHRLTWMGPGTVVTTVNVDSSLPIPWVLYRSTQSAGTCNQPDIAQPITPGTTTVNVQPGTFAGPCVWLVGTIPAGAGIPAGPYNVKLTATMVPAVIGSAWGADLIWYGGWSPPPPLAAASRYDVYVPAAANTGGANGTKWLSDVDLLNAADTDATVEIACLVKNRSNLSPVTQQVTVPAGRTVRLTNVLGSTFQASNAALGVRTLEGRVVVGSRFYNTASKCGGTYGMYVRGEGPEDAIVPGQLAYFNLMSYSPDASEGFRVNVGFVNDSDSSTEVEIGLYGDSGELLKTVPWTLAPYEHRQLTRIHHDPAPATAAVTHGYGTVRVLSLTGRVHAYAMLIDNVSGDPIYMRQTRVMTFPVPGYYDLCVTAAANTGGNNSTRWLSDLDLINPGATDSDVDVECLLKNQANTAPEVHRVIIPAGGTVRLTNVLGSIFTASNAAIGIDIVSGSVGAASRFYNTASACGGTYGMYVTGEDVGQVVGSGQPAYFNLLSYSPDASKGFRVNLGFMNDTPADTSIAIDLFGDDGLLLKTVTWTLAPYEHRQFTRIHHDPAPATAAVTHGWARVRVTAPGGTVHAYAMVIDNVSGDPIYMGPTFAGS